MLNNKRLRTEEKEKGSMSRPDLVINYIGGCRLVQTEDLILDELSCDFLPTRFKKTSTSCREHHFPLTITKPVLFLYRPAFKKEKEENAGEKKHALKYLNDLMRGQ